MRKFTSELMSKNKNAEQEEFVTNCYYGSGSQAGGNIDPDDKTGRRHSNLFTSREWFIHDKYLAQLNLLAGKDYYITKQVSVSPSSTWFANNVHVCHSTLST